MTSHKGAGNIKSNVPAATHHNKSEVLNGFK